ncbi:hypothetical protein GCM10010232_48990 [Streptomyces amakusaensis]|uniref:Uncharacterized protein n=1 Tax=Streptomyces amakusaensis TaxID=67271 RepID=A0ABW0AND7_9ACTN
MPQPTAAHEVTGVTALFALRQALTVRLLNPVELGRQDGAVYTVAFATSTPYVLAGIPVDPARQFTADQARALESALRERRITARVTVPEDVFRQARISLPTTEDVRALTALVWREMPDAHRAAHELRTVLLRLGELHRCPMRSVLPRADGGRVAIGNLTVPQTLFVLRLLGTPTAHFRQNNPRHLDQLAGLLRYRLSKAAPGIQVTADPACSTCQDSRGHEITLGEALPQQARTLAERLVKGPPPTPLQSPGTRTPAGHRRTPAPRTAPRPDPLSVAVRAVLTTAGWTESGTARARGLTMEFGTGPARIRLTCNTGTGIHSLTLPGPASSDGAIPGSRQVTVPCGDHPLPLLSLLMDHQSTLPATMDGFLEAVTVAYPGATVQTDGSEVPGKPS